MKCSNCGMDNIQNDAVHCPNCGASLLTPGNWDSTQQAAPQPQYQQPAPQQQYPMPPPQQYYPPQPPPKPARVATVKSVGLTEVLFLFSGFMLLGAGFDNLGYITVRFIPGAYILLGLIAILAGLFMLAMLLMPNLIKGMDDMMTYVMLGIGALFFLWGLAASFGSSIGIDGGFLVAAGMAALAGGALKMGILK
jgi:hypothetical protein